MTIGTVEYGKMERLKNRSECSVCRVGRRLFYAHTDERGGWVHRVCRRCFEEIERTSGRCHLCRGEILKKVELGVVEENLELMGRLCQRSEKIFRISAVAFSSLGIWGSWMVAKAGAPVLGFYPSMVLGLAGSLASVGLIDAGMRGAQRKLLHYFEEVLNQRLLQELARQNRFSGL